MTRITLRYTGGGTSSDPRVLSAPTFTNAGTTNAQGDVAVDVPDADVTEARTALDPIRLALRYPVRMPRR
jgi:hypothetical protein